MNLGFPELVELVREIKLSETGKPLIDSEIAFLQCAWEGIGYGKFISQQDLLTRKYNHCYNNRLRSKTEKTLSSCGSRLLTLLSNHFHTNIDRVSFKREIQDLINNGIIQTPTRVVNSNEIGVIQQHGQANELILLNQDTESLIQFIKSKTPVASIYGTPGIGKTTLLNYISRHYSNDNTKTVFSDLRYIESFNQFAFEILPQFNLESKIEEDAIISEMFDYLESNSVLVLLDSVIILPEKILAFIESFALRSSSLKSKIIISSQRKTTLNLPDSMIYYYRLDGLKNESDINTYFDSLGLKNERSWKEMAAFYGGNYREIKYAAEFICDFYAGDVGEYWNSGSRVMSPVLVENFNSIKFSPIDINIFLMFSKDKNIISKHIVKSLRSDAGSSNIFARINYLRDLGFLIQNIEGEGKTISFSIAPLLKTYLIQEGIIGD